MKRKEGRESGHRGHNMKALHEAGNSLASKILPISEILGHAGA